MAERYVNGWRRWGTLLEPVLLAEWDQRNPEFILTGGDGLYADPEYPWMVATVDGLAWTSDRELAGIVDPSHSTTSQDHDPYETVHPAGHHSPKPGSILGQSGQPTINTGRVVELR